MKRIDQKDRRTMKQIIEHYNVEKELASKLSNSVKEERKRLYSKIYDELFRRVPHHPQITIKADPTLKREIINSHVRLLSKYFSPEHSFMELGPGDCALSFALCKYFKQVYAIDVSREITTNIEHPANFKLIISDGTSVDVKPETINVAFSNQLMEHLHPEDALDQLRNIYVALVPGGRYICRTPHKYMGPADISRFFDKVSTGLHLKEYTNTELYYLLNSVGFKKVKSYFGIKERYTIIPLFPVMIIECLLKYLPHIVRKNISRMVLIRKLLTIELMAIK